MDTTSIAIGAALILLFIGPILYLLFSQSNKDKQRLKNLTSLGSQHNLNLDQVELSNSLLLGMDSASKKLLIVEPKNNMQFDIVDLRKIDRCLVSKKGVPQENGKSGKTAFTYISLDLIKNNPKEIVSKIVFYDEEEDEEINYDANTQLHLANKWDQLIKNNLSA